MSKNLIPEIVKLLGVEIGEEFKIKGEDELMTYRFNSDGLQVTYDGGIEIPYIATNLTFVALVKGENEIVKLHWKPKKREEYYSFDFMCENYWVVYSYVWLNSPRDYALLGKGWVYRTEAEAQAALPKVAAEIGAKYRL